MGNKPLKPLSQLPMVKNMEKMNIAVFVVATPGIHEYTKYTIPLIEEWTRRHGYHFFLIEENKLLDLPINFTKIKVILDLFENIPQLDCVMHIDADAPIINLDYSIENVIQHYDNHSSIIKPDVYFSEDCFNKNDCSQPGKQNTGIFIVKNTMVGRSFLKFWITSARTTCKQYANTFPNCQLVLWNCVMPKYKMHVKTLPYNVLNGRDGLLVNHLMQESNNNRNKIAKEMHINLLNKRTGVYN